MNKIISILIFLTCTLMYGQTKKLELEDFIVKRTFSQKSVYGLVSTHDGKYYTTLENNSINKYSYKDGSFVSTIFNADSVGEKITIQAYNINDDESKILLVTNYKPIYRRSYTADFYIYDMAEKKLLPVSKNGSQQLATISPDGTKVAFVRNNNMYVKNILSDDEEQITTDGKFNSVINGAPDWVYEEEFGFNKGFAWSPDGEKIAYMRFDESNVKMYNMQMYEGEAPKHEENSLYPGFYSYKYPKAGEDNSVVTVKIYDINTKQTVNVDLGTETNQYIPRIKWTKSENKLAVIRVNRLQNHYDILFADANTGKSQVVYSEDNKYYIEESTYDNIIFVDEDMFLLTSERDGYRHIYSYDMKKKEYFQITKGNWDVTNFDGYDSDDKVVYYTAADIKPYQTNIYSIKINGKRNKRLNEHLGTNSAVFSASYDYFINYFSNSTTPLNVTLYDNSGKAIRVLEDNKKYVEQISEYQYNTKEFFTFANATDDTLNGYMIKPVNFDSTKKYPVLMTQYSGPNSQSVVDEWSFNWYNYLSQEQFLIVCVDPRGTAARGEEFRKCTYMQIGKYESDDQIAAAKYLKTLPYVDDDNIAIWGWSYGGFMVSLCMTKSDVFKAGVAIAPVTNWRYYDNIYTERYMRTPQENPKGYDDNSPIYNAAGLSGNLLLIHGTADDNVHFQNSIEFAEKLVQAGKQFDMMVYNNRNHGIYGGNTSSHLYTKFINFLKNNLQKQSDNE